MFSCADYSCEEIRIGYGKDAIEIVRTLYLAMEIENYF